jgi:WD40 repeat protein
MLRSVRLWDIPARAMSATVTERTKITATAFSPDGRTLATGSNDGAVRFYDAATGHPRGAFDWQIGPISTLTFAPDGLRAAAGGRKGTIVVWDVDA